MDHLRFDTITRVIGSRRSLVGGVAAAMTLAASAGPDTFAKKKKKKKPCKGGTIKCGKVCVNTSTDTQNCGGCGVRCGSGQACVSGSCTSTGPGSCPTGQVLCSSVCVDTQSDPRNCGACGDTCGAGETCSGGQCRTGSGYPCNDVFDCGGRSRGVVCLNGQCACEDPAKGLCSDPKLGSSADCNVCCPGGNRSCPGDEVCRGPSSPQSYCGCPSGTEACPPFQESAHRCSTSRASDPKRCGANCQDCKQQNTGARCCAGTCIIGGFPGEPDDTTERQICGSDCTRCPSGTICCNNGPATAPECVAPRAGTGVCPSAGG